MWSSIATLIRYGWASSARAIAGYSASVAYSTGRCVRAAAQSLRARRRSNARPRTSSWSSAARSGTGDLLFQALSPPEPRVQAVGGEQRRVLADRDDAPSVEHHDAIGGLRHAQTMRHDEHGEPARAQRPDDRLLGRGVDTREDVVEDEHARAPGQRAG